MYESGRLAEGLNVLPGTRWFFNLRGRWAFVVALLLSPTAMWINDYLLVWGKVWPFSYQWLSALFDGLLAVGLGLLVWMANYVGTDDLPRATRSLLGSRLAHVIILLVWAGFSIGHALQESDSVNSWARRTGPNALYHNVFLVPFLGYCYTVLLIVGVSVFFTLTYMHGAGMPMYVVVLLALAIGGAWLWAGAKFDATHQLAPNGISKHYYANPPDPWCGGAITVHICGPAHR